MNLIRTCHHLKTALKLEFVKGAIMSLFLFGIVLICTLIHMIYKKKGWTNPKSPEIFLSYFLFFNVGVMGIVAFIMHIFWGPYTAKMIGWQPDSPFQFEIGMANLAFGVLGIIAFWRRGHFWEAVIIGWSVFLLGCFVGHVLDYYQHQNTAPWNWGTFLWFNDLFLPIVALVTLSRLGTYSNTNETLFGK